MVSGLLLVTTFCFQTSGLQAASNQFRPDNPSSPPSLPPISIEMRGDIFMARKMYREALEMYQSGPADSAVLANKTGIAYHQLLNFAGARKFYERAIKLKPDYAEAINNLGAIYYTAKSYRRAISQYKKALRLEPDSASILSNLGTGYFARKNYELAFATYQKALTLDPNVFENRSTVGVLLQERSVEDRAKFHYYLARTYAKAGDIEHALMYIRKALEEGFKDATKFQQDPEFAAVRQNPEFEQIFNAEHKAL